jgi:hypothetical protein
MTHTITSYRQHFHRLFTSGFARFSDGLLLEKHDRLLAGATDCDLAEFDNYGLQYDCKAADVVQCKALVFDCRGAVALTVMRVRYFVLRIRVLI